MVVLIPIDLLVSQLPIQVLLHEAEGEGKLDVVGQLSFELIEALHLND